MTVILGKLSGMSGKGKLCSDRLMRKDEQLGAGSSLLNFMNFASGNLKSALEKPANFKRNINHRRYLQKQLRNYSKRKNEVSQVRKSGGAPRTKTGTKANEKNNLAKNISNAWRTEINSSEIIADVKMEKASALRDRNLPSSFWQEPVMPTPLDEYGNFYGSLQQIQTRNPVNQGSHNTEYESFLESWEDCERRELSPKSSHCDSVPSISSADESISEEFLTGEELTRSIDIKDLYVPELYITDRTAEESQEELYITTPMSPSQYILSPSDQGFFNFSFDQDAQSHLPPFALAFLNPGSLSAQLCE